MLLTMLLISTVSLAILIGGIFLVLKRIKYINFYNLSIYMILICFWIVVVILDKSIEKVAQVRDNVWYIYPILVVIMSFTQALVRYPLGWFSRHIHSRKIPILLVTLIFMLTALPFFFSSARWTLFIGAFGVGVFSSSFGLDALYVSENWSMKHVFTATFLLSIIPWIGLLIYNIFNNAFKMADGRTTVDRIDSFVHAARWVLLGTYIIAAIAATYYVFFIKERPKTMRKFLDDKVAKSYGLPQLGAYKIFLLTVPAVLVSIASRLVTNAPVQAHAIDLVVGDENQSRDIARLSGVIASSVAIVTSAFISFYAVKKMSIFKVMLIAKIGLVASLIMGVIIFFTKSTYMPLMMVFLILVTIFFITTEYAYFGTALCVDHYNKNLVFAIFLSMRSISYSISDAAALEVTTIHKDAVADKWLVLGALILSLAALIMFTLFNRKKLRPLFEFITINELWKIGVNEGVWKPLKKKSSRKVVVK